MRVPIWLTLIEHRVGDAAVDALLQAAGVGDEQVVADELDPAAERLGQRRPAVPVVLGHAVLDRHDRVGVDEPGPVLDQLVGAEHLALAGEVVAAVAVELADRRVDGDGDVVAGHEPGGVDGLDEELDGVLVASAGRGRSRPRRRRRSTARGRGARCLRTWYVSAPQRSASAKLGAPTGMIMNSWKSIELSACTPPLTTFIIGTGRTWALAPPT